MLSRFTHDIIATPLKSSVVFSSSVPASTRLSPAITRLSTDAGVSTLAVQRSTITPSEGRTDNASTSRNLPSKKSKSGGVRKGKYERPTTFAKAFDPKIFHYRFIDAFTRARARFDSTIDYALWDLKTPAPRMALSEPARLSITSLTKTQLGRKSSLEERTAAAIAKLVRLGYVAQARKVLHMSNQLRTRFSPASLAMIARAVANAPSPQPAAAECSKNPSPSEPSHPTPEQLGRSKEWFLWELRPQLYDAAKRKQRDALYQAQLTGAIEEFMWCSFDLRDWRGVLETFNGTAMNMKAQRGGAVGGLPSVKICQLAMQALFARHYYDSPRKEKGKMKRDEERGPSGSSRTNPVKEGYSWSEPSDHPVLFRKIAAMVEVMRKSGIDPLYPEVYAILLRELGRLVSSGKTLMSVKLVEDWLVYYEAAMAVRIPPQTSTSTPSEPSSSSPPLHQSQPPTSIILAAAEAILNILEEAKNQLGFQWSKAGHLVIARQKHEYLEATLKPAFDEVMGYLEGPSPPRPLGETINQHAKTQSVFIRLHLLQDDVRAAWGVWTQLVEQAEESAGPKDSQASQATRSGNNLRRFRPAIPPTTSLRLDSAYIRILHTAHRLNDLDFISTTALPFSSRVLLGRNPMSFADIWRKTLETLIRQPPIEEERLRLLGALRTLDKVLEERDATSVSATNRPHGGPERSDVMRGVFTGALVDAVRMWWSASDMTRESTKQIGEMFEKFGVVLKVPLKKRLSSPRLSEV
ncbi:hypothetical protein FS837_003974 [Tulasnella sp. UAMH 9824]|nr:hypothetical protein FS837_003974 [Tulasnella sp. UAMH 9824]